MPQIRKLLVAAFIGLTVPACAEQMQVPGSAVILDLPVGFTAAHGGLEHERLQALVRVDTNKNFVFWEQFFQISARAYRPGKLDRADAHLYFFYHWPDSSDGEFNLVFNQDGVTASVRLEVNTASIANNAITVNQIERILASARIVTPPPPVKP